MSTVQILFKHYDGVVDSPEAVSKLRKFILDLAVRGRLVEQNPDDEPADELLQRICREKLKLMKSGEIRKKEFSPDQISESLFKVPKIWKWVRLCQIGGIVGGGTPRTSEPENFASPGSGVAWITPADLGKLTDLYVDRGRRDISDQGLSSSSARLVPTGSILFSCRAPIGYVAISSNPVSTNQGIKTLIPYISGLSKYVAYVLSHFAVDIDASAPGTTYREISGKLFARVLIPLPPLAEQHRIVAKVDELMERCNRLDENFKEREDHRKRFTKASFASLTESGMESKEYRKRSGFVIKNFDRLAENINQIKKLRQLILDLAVRGRLVEQNPNDESVDILLDRIANERQKLIGFGETGKQNTDHDDVSVPPFEIPSGWNFIRFGIVHQLIRGVTYSKSDVSKERNEGYVPVLRANNIGSELTNDNPVFVKQERVSNKQILRNGDFLIALSSGSKNLVGKSVFVSSNRIEAFGGFCGVIRLVDSALQEFVRVYLQSSLFREGISGSSRGIGINNLKKSSLENILFPLPPLAEQHRIGAKVDELFAICTELESSHHSRERFNAKLLDANLHGVYQCQSRNLN